MYIGETLRSIQIRLKEHSVDIIHGQINNSALAEHSITFKHHILMEDTKVITNIDQNHYTRRRVREAIEIEKHPLNINQDDGWKLRRTWAPTINQLKNNKLTTS